MPMVDLVVSKGDRKWRNRGLNSVPMAHTWEPVGRAAGGGLFLSAYAEEKVEGSETDFMWGTLAERVPVTDAFTGTRTVVCLARSSSGAGVVCCAAVPCGADRGTQDVSRLNKACIRYLLKFHVAY